MKPQSRSSAGLFPGEFGKRSFSIDDLRAQSGVRSVTGTDDVRTLRTRIGSHVAHIHTWPEMSVHLEGDHFGYPQDVIAIGALTRGHVRYEGSDGRVLEQSAGQGIVLPGAAEVRMSFAAGTVSAGFLVPLSEFPSLGGQAPGKPMRLVHPSVSVTALHSLAHSVVAQQTSIAVRQQELLSRAVDALLVAIGIENGFFGRSHESPILTRMRIDAYLNSKFSDPTLSIESVAAEFRLSRRTLQRAYEGSGTTLWQEVTRLRVEHASGLLRDPASAGLSVEQIRMLSGFSSSSQMRRAFSVGAGISPAATRSSAV